MNKEQKWYEYIPGFRSGRKWKKVASVIYYLFCLFAIIDSFGVGLFLLSMPFLIFYGGKLILNRIKGIKNNRILKGIFLSSILAFFLSLGFFPTSENGASKAPDKEKVVFEEEKEKREEEERKAKSEKKIEEVKEKKEKERLAEEKKKKEEEEKRLAEEKKKKEEEEKRLAEEKKKKEEEEKRLAEEKKKKEEEEKRLAEEKKKKEEEKKTASSNNNSGGGNSSSGGNKKPFPKVKETETNTDFPYLINTSTGKFHKTTCNSAKKTKESNRKYAKERDSIINSGYSPCGRCNP